MRVTIDLNPEQERLLRAEAFVRGEEAEHLASQVVTDWLRGTAAAAAPSVPGDSMEDRERRARMQEILATARARAGDPASSSDALEAEAISACDEVRSTKHRARKGEAGL